MNKRTYIPKLGIFFAISFVINLIWEIAHSGLYRWLPPMEKTFGHFVWFSVKDTFFYLAFVLAVALISLRPNWFEKPKIGQLALVFAFGLIFSVYIEYAPIRTGRWDYLPSMPIIPFLNVGLTPILQMSLGAVAAILLSRSVIARLS